MMRVIVFRTRLNRLATLTICSVVHQINAHQLLEHCVSGCWPSNILCKNAAHALDEQFTRMHIPCKTIGVSAEVEVVI